MLFTLDPLSCGLLEFSRAIARCGIGAYICAKTSCIILGRGEDDAKVREWLSIAAAVPGFIGFAVGRTSFWDPLVAWLAMKVTRDQAVDQIAARYHEFVTIFETHQQAVTA